MQQINLLNQFFDLIFVEKLEGKLNFSKTIKNKNSFKIVDEYVEYKLDTIKLDTIFQNVIKDLSNFKKINKIKLRFDKRNFIEKILFKNDYTNIFKKIKLISQNYSWIIIPTKHLNIITKSDFYVENSENRLSHNPLISCVGKFENLNLYLNPNVESDKLIFGNYDSATILVKIENELEVGYTLLENTEITELQII